MTNVKFFIAQCDRLPVVEHATHKGLILVVEDERPLAHVLELKLQNEGYKVLLAHDGRECLDLITKEKFTIILLDLLLPFADGFTILRKVMKMPNPPTVFVLSNLRQPEDEERALKLGAKKYFVKSDTQLDLLIKEIKQV